MSRDDGVARGTPRQATSQTAPDVSDWLTKADAAAAIGRSTKAVERLAKAGQLQQAFRRQAGSADVAVYHPDDVARIASARRAGPLPAFLVPGPAELPINGAGALARVADTPQSVASVVGAGDDILRVLVTAAMKVLSETSQTPSLFVTIAEAEVLSGLPGQDLRALIHAGDLPARKTARHGWRIRRRDLENL